MSPPPPRTWELTPATLGERADAYLARQMNCGVRQAADWCRAGRLRIGARRLAKGDALPGAGLLVLEVPDEVSWLSPDPSLPCRLAFADEDVVVLDKAPGVPTHPLRAGEGGTAADAVSARYPEVALASADPREGGACHRLDTDTSGLLAFARRRDIWEELRADFAAGRVGRAYLAWVHGAMRGVLDVVAPIVHDGRDPRRMVALTPAATSPRVMASSAPHRSASAAEPGRRIRGQPREARTRAQAIGHAFDVTLLLVRAAGGRRHQVRVHLAHAGFPLVGDTLYGGRPVSAPGHGQACLGSHHLLHAVRLDLPRRPRLVAPPPAAFCALAEALGLTEGLHEAAERASALEL